MKTVIVMGFVVLAVPIALQILLSSQKNKWPGLVLPGISLIISLLAAIGNFTFQAFQQHGQIVMDQNGKIISKVEINPVSSNSAILSSLILFILYNMPTVVLLVIYFGFSNKRRKLSEFEKMKIEDLN